MKNKFSSDQKRLFNSLVSIGWTELFPANVKSALILQLRGLIRTKRWPNNRLFGQKVSPEDFEIIRLRTRMKAVIERETRANEAVEAFFRPRVEAKLEEGDFKGAQELANKMPPCGAQASILDTIERAKTGRP